MRTPAELVDALLVAMAAYDGVALAPLLSDDVVWWSPPSASRMGAARPMVGKDEVVRVFTGGLGIYRAGTITWDLHQLIADDASIAARFTRRSLTAAGKPYENEYCFVLRYVDGRIVEGWEFTDTAHAYDQFA
ncbi:MAG: nuclear transport factor 2 family protein [Acidimicrobiales bacterium]